jgi:hypothetical protein
LDLKHIVTVVTAQILCRGHVDLLGVSAYHVAGSKEIVWNSSPSHDHLMGWVQTINRTLDAN